MKPGGVMKNILKAALLCLCLGAFPSAAQEEDDAADYQKMMEQMMRSGNNYAQAQSQSWDARLKAVAGAVMVKTVDADEWSKISGEMPLDPNDMVKTGPDGQAELYFDDKGVISVGRNTELEVSSLEQEDAVLTINFGSLVAKIKHFLNAKHKFEVRTPSAVCAIRGTEFAVEYSQMGKEASVAVFDEGRVAVTQADDPSGRAGQEYLLEKNTEIVFNPSQKRFRPTPLSRMGRHRGALNNVRKRLSALKGWKPLSASRRADLRNRALKRKIIRKELGGKARAVKKAVKKRVPVRKKGKRAAPPPEEE